MNESAIGVFDSGIGGLTVLKEISRLLPSENTIYLGDTARVPYGSKSKETIIRYSFEDALFLIRREIKLLVVACNTASAFAISELQKSLKVPVIGVIEPGARRAALSTKTGKIGVIGTEGTIKSSAYTAAIKANKPDASVTTKPCPLFVPLVEEGLTEGAVTRLVAEGYLAPLRDAGIDTLVLGCTHYPLLKNVIAEVMGKSIRLIDSAEAIAEEVKTLLDAKDMMNRTGKDGSHGFFVTDSPERFVEVGRRFYGTRLENALLVRLEA